MLKLTTDRLKASRGLFATAELLVLLNTAATYYLLVSPSMFDNNVGKYGPIFTIFSPFDLYENFLCTYHKYFRLTCNMLLHHLVKVENPKMFLILTVTSTNC